MGIWAWLILLAISAAIATLAEILFFRTIHPRPTDYDWVFLAGGALIGGFTANIWYGAAWNIGPVIDGLYLVPALVGSIFLAAVAELIYRMFVRPRQAT